MNTRHKYRSGGSSQCGSRRRYRYGGSSIFSNLLGRTLVRDSVQKLINSATKPGITQKVVDAVVDGSTNALKTAAQKGIEGTASAVKTATQRGIDSIIKKKNRQAINKAIEKLTVGKGIVYD